MRKTADTLKAIMDEEDEEVVGIFLAMRNLTPSRKCPLLSKMFLMQFSGCGKLQKLWSLRLISVAEGSYERFGENRQLTLRERAQSATHLNASDSCIPTSLEMKNQFKRQNIIQFGGWNILCLTEVGRIPFSHFQSTSFSGNKRAMAL